jgi:hypothetical protein
LLVTRSMVVTLRTGRHQDSPFAASVASSR